tara:strand:+ start:128 stop:319 length:192 start_codon:yes stop_codon:yes gene_type:complete
MTQDIRQEIEGIVTSGDEAVEVLRRRIDLGTYLERQASEIEELARMITQVYYQELMEQPPTKS